MPIQDFASRPATAEFMLPSQAMAGAERLKGLQNQNAMFDMEVQDKKDAAMANQKLNALFQQSGGDLSKMRQGVGDFRTAMTLDKQIGENAKLQGEGDKARLEGGLKKLEYGSQLLQGATPENWQQIRAEFGKMTGQDLGEQYDPNKVGALMQQGLSMKDKLEAQLKQQGFDVQMRGQDITARGQDITLRGQDMRASGEGKPKNQIIYDAQGQGYVIDVNDPSLTPRPIGMGGAQAEQGADVFKKAVTTPQASEDERKAAGWLSQARLASQQMKEAMTADPTVSNKPFSESLAERLPFVKEEDINAQRSPQRQRFTAAASSFSEAALRAATGAGINEMEAKQKIAELTPVYGESKESIADKMARQEMYISSLEQRAGRAAPKNPAPTGKRMSMLQLQRAAADKFGGDMNAARQAAQQHGYSINE